MTIDKPNTLYFPDRKLWVLQDDYFDTTAKVIINQGFKYDGASIPRFLWVVIDPIELSEAAPLVHDYLYRNAGLEVLTWRDEHYASGLRYSPKIYADKLFDDIMRKWKVESWKRVAAYEGVKQFAGFAWREHLKKNIA